MDIIKDRDTGRMKGFAFVTMNSDEEAQEAIKILNEKMLDDRAIKVNIARPREEQPRRGSQLSDSRKRTGGLLSHFRHTPTAKHAARVVAKAGRVIGGSDVDHWLLLEVLKQTRLTLPELSHDYAALLTHCEQAKIDLSTRASTTFLFEAQGRAYPVFFTRGEFEQMLEANGFYAAIRHARQGNVCRAAA